MRVARVTWLIVLTLVATTLPASAWRVPSLQAKPTARAENTRKPAAKPPASTPDEKSTKLKIAPNTELWDGSSTRTASSTAGPLLICALLGGNAGHRIGTPTLARAVVSRQPTLAAPRPTGWLIGHYAHAPPCSA